ncbi:tektin-like protein 1 isoform X2 [Petromyzon marinus]|uniref:Coiled-coil domain-containing protein 105 n=1 Tax=Petromyzon marinus TaxID=7757 RepID=A0AAJ7T225_PETMA|nr:coiled-coil domain-containing protein 105 [Petromyzon marinus]
MSLAACSEAWGVCENAGNSRSKARGRAMLPTSREVEVNVSVRHMYLYSREVRGVVARLRAECGSLSVHAVALAHSQGDLKKALGHVRNEKQANVQASSMRSRRPTREVGPDEVDVLLGVERKQLAELESVLAETLLRAEALQQNLALCRKRLLACISERSCVLDLIGHATPSRLSHTTPSAQWSPDPIGPLSPECARMLEEAAQGQKEVMAIRSEIGHVIKKVAHLQSRARQRVTQGLGQKLVQTNCLARALQVSAGHTRMAIHQAQRWHAAISTAQGYIEGPKRYGDIPLRERLDRPMVKVYQRHPGTQLPEATGVLQAGEGLSHSLAACKGDLEQLVSAQHMLAADLRDKVAATRVDAEAARFRRRCATLRY